MKETLISVDGPLHLCLVPDVVSDNLYKYIFAFDDYFMEYKKTMQVNELEYRLTIDEIEGFIE